MPGLQLEDTAQLSSGQRDQVLSLIERITAVDGDFRTVDDVGRSPETPDQLGPCSRAHS